MKEYKMQCIDDEKKKNAVWVKNFKTIEVNMERFKKMWYDNSINDIDKYKYLMMIDMNEEELESLRKAKGCDDIVEEYVDKVSKLNRNLNFINTIGKEKEREYVFNTRLELAVEQKQIDMIKTMSSNGLCIEDISKYTDIPIEEIQTILEG